MKLGKSLATELGLDISVDTLSRWMAHDIAELIHDAEHASAKDKPAKLKECREAILSLWKARQDLPHGRRPFQRFEPILQALESLDPTNSTPRYFRHARPEQADEAGENSECRKWLEVIDGIDYSARILIRYCLARAAQTATPGAKQWIELAKKAATDDDDLHVIRVVIGEVELSEEAKPDDAERKAIEDRLARLNSLLTLSAVLSSELQLKLDHGKKSNKTESSTRKKPGKIKRASPKSRHTPTAKSDKRKVKSLSGKRQSGRKRTPK